MSLTPVVEERKRAMAQVAEDVFKEPRIGVDKERPVILWFSSAGQESLEISSSL